MSEPVKAYLYNNGQGWRVTWIRTATADIPATAIPNDMLRRVLDLAEWARGISTIDLALIAEIRAVMEDTNG
jgi:hypothetical protein